MIQHIRIILNIVGWLYMTTGHHADLQNFLRLCMLELSSQNARGGIWGLRWLGMAFPCLHQLLQILWALVGLSGCCSLLALEVSLEIVGGVEREAKDSCCHTANNIYHLDLIVAGWPWGVEVWKKWLENSRWHCMCPPEAASNWAHGLRPDTWQKMA